jgi:hypothetical protein
MSKSNMTDGAADTIAATVLVTIIIGGVILWLNGMPA